MPAIDFSDRRGWIVAFLGEEEHVTLVAELGGEPVGFATLEGGYLHQFVVASATKGSGLSRRLLDAAKSLAPDGLALDVNQANGRAVHFYEREGFVVTGEGVNPGSGLATFAMLWPRGLMHSHPTRAGENSKQASPPSAPKGPLHFLTDQDNARKAPIADLDRVRLTRRIVIDCGATLEAGSRGTVVSVYGDGEAFCVEFTAPVQALATIDRGGIEAIPEETIARLASSSKPLRR